MIRVTMSLEVGIVGEAQFRVVGTRSSGLLFEVAGQSHRFWIDAQGGIRGTINEDS